MTEENDTIETSFTSEEQGAGSIEDTSDFMAQTHFAAPEAAGSVMKETTISADDVNAVLAETDDGRTIILCDYKFNMPPSVVIVNLNTSLVNIGGGDFGSPGIELQYPVESAKIDIWKNEPITYFAYVDEHGGRELYEVPVHFVEI